MLEVVAIVKSVQRSSRRGAAAMLEIRADNKSIQRLGVQELEVVVRCP